MTIRKKINLISFMLNYLLNFIPLNMKWIFSS